ncbi:hypothetical protein GCM10023081_14040 [Arthrobacter ginkgonis]|uniref:Uncharacterized protein n=1 Tax=Arthrobacter ginkgonis TaxID=1630594 RepID=A0ABP7C1T2_9MICC
MVNPTDHTAAVDLTQIGDTPLRLKRRELALISERIFQHLGVPYGAWAAARNHFLDTAVRLGAGALEGLAEAVEAGAPERFGVDASAKGRRLEARGQHALLVGAQVGHALEAQLAGAEEAVVSVVDIRSPHQLAGVVHRLARRGAAVEVIEGAASATLRARGRLRPGPPSSHADLVHGIEAAPMLWWSLYNTSTLALSQVTEISRYHTGNSPSPTRRRLAIK